MSRTTGAAFPRFVYKILPSAPFSPLPDSLPLSDLDETDRFLHLSDAQQVPITSSLFFTNSTELWILKIDSAKAATVTDASELRWAPKFPGAVHLYGWKEASGKPETDDMSKLGSGNVVDVKSFVRKEGESWAQAYGNDEGWLVDA